MIPMISMQRFINDVSVRCYGCGQYLDPNGIDSNYFLFCKTCGQVHDVRPTGYHRKAVPPNFKVVSRLRPDGSVLSRRVPLDSSDSQLSLFGGL